MTKTKIEKILRNNGKFLTETTGMERASQGASEGMRWRIGSLANDGIHGFAGGQYFKTLSDVSDFVEFNYH